MICPASRPQPPGAGRGDHRAGRASARAGRTAAAAALCAILAAGACGRKGPPLPPLVRLPAAVGEFTARRVGSRVLFQFTIPAANTDGARPADLLQVEIYGHTGRLASPAEYLKAGTLVGAVKVRPPATGETPGAPAEPVAEAGVEQGAVATFWEKLTPEALTLPAVVPGARGPLPQGPLQGTTSAPAAGSPPVAAKDGGVAVQPVVLPPPPQGRFYVAVGVSRRGRRGALSPAAGIAIVPSPASPSGVRVAYGPDGFSIDWAPGERPAGASGAEPAAAAGEAAAPPVEFAFNVYEVGGADRAAAPGAGVEPGASAPLNAAQLTGTSFADGRIEFGKERCYSVRAVVTIADLRVESEPSPSICVTPVDTFPPAAPQALAAVSSERAISLIWEANTEKDLGGYLVLRGEAPGDTLAALTRAPIRETTYHDQTARPGVTYVYAVVAVDTATPPNVSERSNRVTETVR